MKKLCFYHADDMDGLACGAIFRKFMPESERIPISYGADFPWDRVDHQTEVWMADYSLPPKEMIKLKDEAGYFVWVDHHAPIIEELGRTGHEFLGERRTQHSACHILYHFANYPLHLPTPEGIRLISDWDTWKHQDPMVCHFHFGSELWDVDPAQDSSKAYWDKLFGNDPQFLGAVKAAGAPIFAHQKKKAAKFLQQNGFETVLHGVSALAINLPISAMPYIFESMDWDHNPVGIAYTHTYKHWIVSLRSRDVDVAEMARIHGGNGHRTAAGFRCDMLPFAPSV